MLICPIKRLENYYKDHDEDNKYMCGFYIQRHFSLIVEK